MDRPSLEALPWVVSHGDQVWQALLVAAALLAIGWAWRRRRRAGQRRIADALAAAATPPSIWADGAEVTVHGVLHVAPRTIHSVAAVGLIAGREQAQHGDRGWPGASLAVDDDGGPRRLLLDGALTIVVGSRAQRRRSIPTAYFDQAIRARDRTRAAMLVDRWRGGILGFHVRTLDDGDRVAARGVLVRAAAADEQGYRDGGAQWTLAPVHGGIEVAARRPALDPPRLTLRAIVGHGVGAAGITLAIMLGLSAITGAVAVGPGGSLAWTQAVVACLPGKHDVLIQGYRDALARAADPGRVAALAAISAERDGPAAAIAVLEGHGRLDAALAEARRQHEDGAATHLLLALGRYPEAAAIPAGGNFDGAELAYLVAGAGSRASAPILASLGPDPYQALEELREPALSGLVGHLVCVALDELWRDEPVALYGLEKLAIRGAAACAVLAAEHLDDEVRRAWLEQMQARRTSPWLDERRYLDGSGDTWPRAPSPDQLLDPAVPPLPARALAALARTDAIDGAVERASRIRVLQGAIGLGVLAGDHAEVERRLAALAKLDDAAARDLAAAIALRWTRAPRPARDGARLIRDWSATGMPGGVALWTALHEVSPTTRGQVATWLAYRPRPRPALEPLAMAWRAGFERDLATAVGDAVAAARWDAVAQAHLAVATRPDLAVLLEQIAATPRDLD